jgi:hypothetical protein
VEPAKGSRTAILIAHPRTPAEAVTRIGAQVRRVEDRLSLLFTLDGGLETLAIPDGDDARRADRLWQHTCFEAFVACSRAEAYYEINLSPSGQWAIYRFEGYRHGMRSVLEARPEVIAVRREPDRLSVKATLDVTRCGDLQACSWKVGLAAVVEDAHGAICYWALKHPADKADFHRREAFALLLDPSP